MSSRLLNYTAAVVVAAAAWTVAPQNASACGGLFCDNNQPVNQAAESIIFADSPDGTVTAVVQILYEGPSDQFAWVLPVPTVPDVGVSSNLAFTRLQSFSNPVYTLNTTTEGECKEEDFAQSANDVNNANNFNNSNNVEEGGVNVLASGSVGPYNYDVIEVTGNPEVPVQIALDWLEDNGYDITALAPDLLAEYLDMGMKFIAFKLNKTKDAGDIRPIVITYDTDHPMIPIKLTAVAANDDMGVLVWVLGEHRAVPTNYKDLVLNEALINWFNPNTTYNDVVVEAANEAEGQGFVTEKASTSEQYAGVVVRSGEIDRWNQISTGTTDGREWFDEVHNLFAFGGTDPVTFGPVPWDGFEDAIDLLFMDFTDEEREAILRDGGNIFYEERRLPGTALEFPVDFDLGLANMTIQDFVVDPMVVAQDLLDNSKYVSRMYTTMSAAEMTLDPEFDFNPDLDDWDNNHSAEMVIECSPELFRSEAPFRVTLADGNVVRGSQQQVWPITADMGLPYNSQIRQQSTSGGPTVVTDNVATIRQALEDHNATVPTGEERGAKAAGGCSTAPNAANSAWWLLLGFAALFRRRRN